MAYPRVIPHSDGAGVIDRVGGRVSESRIGERVWCFGAQSYRPFGTAAEYVVLPSEQAVRLPERVSFEQGACLGIAGITAHRAVHAAGRVQDHVLLVQGGAGAVGQCAIALARRAGARVIATVRKDQDAAIARRAGAHEVVCTAGLRDGAICDHIFALAPSGLDHIVEVDFHSNILVDEKLLRLGGAIAAYATSEPAPAIPFWPLLFKNARLYLLGSDDFPIAAKVRAGRDLNETLRHGWSGLEIAASFPLEAIAQAHEFAERPQRPGKVVVLMNGESP
jgi:NADPH2:quinone reductase